MLRRVRITGYKTLRNVEVTLSPLTVIFGPNAAGKSNFLDALQLLSKLASSRTLQEAFEPPYRGKPLESFSLGQDGLRGLVKQDTVEFLMEVDFDLSRTTIDSVNRQLRDLNEGSGETESDRPAKNRLTERMLRYRVRVEMLPRSGLLRVADEFLAALNSSGEVTGKRKPFIERVKNKIHLRLEGQAHPKYYERYLDHTVLSMPHYPAHYPHLVAARQEISRWAFFYFEPRERMRAANPVKEVHHIGLMGEELPAYLNTLKALQPKQFSAVEKALRMLLPQVDRIDLEVNDIGEVELRLVERGIPMPARILSEGTLRILGMLALTGAANPPPLLGLEEPENGIHPKRIAMIAELLRARGRENVTQYIVTTHSPLIADAMDDNGLFAVQRLAGGTSITPLEAWGPLGRSDAVSDALEHDDEVAEPVSERIMRGDFDG